MATRHNSCVNPALANDNSGWGGASTPARTAVSGFGRPFAARYTSGTFLSTSAGAATPGMAYTISAFVRPDNAFSGGGGAYIEWRNAANGVISYSNGSYSLSGGGVVVRASITGTAPSNTATAQLILDGVNYSLTTFDATMVLIEQTGSLLDYFDGDSAGASWDGTPGNSSSTLDDTPAITASIDAGLPPLGAAAEASTVAVSMLAAGLPPLTADAAATVRTDAQLAASLPGLAATGGGQIVVASDATAGLPSLSAAVAGQVLTPAGTIAATLPPLAAALAGASDVAELDVPPMVGPPRLGWPIGTPGLAWDVRPPVLGGE